MFYRILATLALCGRTIMLSPNVGKFNTLWAFLTFDWTHDCFLLVFSSKYTEKLCVTLTLTLTFIISDSISYIELYLTCNSLWIKVLVKINKSKCCLCINLIQFIKLFYVLNIFDDLKMTRSKVIYDTKI